MRRLCLSLAVSALAGLGGAAQAAPAFLKLQATLDEPNHYCLDLRGHGANLQLDAPVQAHACKEGHPQDDQHIESDRIAKGQLFLLHYDRCVSADAPRTGAVRPRTCGDDPLQAWIMEADGLLRLKAAPALCLSVGAEPGHRTGSPSGVVWLGRPLELEACAPAAAERQRWLIASPLKPSGTNDGGGLRR
jgi:hypothetical protein